MGMNLAGAEVALKLVERIEELERKVEELTNEANRLRTHLRASNKQPSTPS
jgi:predicted transcriptional regulator